MRFSVNFGHEKILLWNFLEFIRNSIGMPVKSGIKIFEIWVARNSVTQRIPGKCLGRSKFGHAENSWEMLDQ